MNRFAFALVAGAALAAAPLAAQQQPMAHPQNPACAGMAAMHMGMMGAAMPMGGGMQHSGMHGGQPGAMGGMMSGAMAQRHEAMMSLLPPAALLSARETLALSDEQVSRLEHIRDEMRESHADAMDDTAEEWGKAMDALAADKPDLDAYKHALEELSEQRIETHVAVVKSAIDARSALTDEQRAKLPDVARQAMQQCMMGAPNR